VLNTVMTIGRGRLAGMLCLAVIGLAQPAGAGNGPPGGGGGAPPGGGFGGPPGGGFGPGSRGSNFGPNRSDGYNYTAPKFDFSVRRTQPAPQRIDHTRDGQQQQQPRNQPSTTPETDFWQRFRNGFGVFGGG